MTTPYADSIFAADYFSERLGTAAWDDANVTDRDKALKQATRSIDRLAFHGTKTVDTQANEFPRNGETSVPVAVKEATCEQALALLEGRDYESLARSGIASESVGDASVSYLASGKGGTVQGHGGLTSVTAFDLLAQFLVDPQAVDLVRV